MRYCKIKGKDIIYEVKEIKEDVAILTNKNSKVQINTDKIEYMPDDFKPERSGSTGVKIHTTKLPNEIMLRHKYKEEAIEELDKYIDQAIVAKLGRIRIIHGKHGGVLREAVHNYLKNSPYVKEYYIADCFEGGLGVTIAILGKKTT